MSYVSVEVDVDDVIADVSTEEFYRGSSDDALWDAVRTIGRMMDDPTLRGLLGEPRDGEKVHSHPVSHDDGILDSMIDETRQINDYRLSMQLQDAIERFRYPNVRVRAA